MIKSMTAFASDEITHDFGVLTWELRSVNHRYLEVVVRMPEDFRVLEQAIREKVAEKLKRGKVECLLRYKAAPITKVELEINEDAARTVINAFEKLKSLSNSNSSINPIDLLRWQGVIQDQEVALDPLRKAALELLDNSLQSLLDTRMREGKNIYEMLTDRCNSIATIVESVRKRYPQVLKAIREKIELRLNELSVKVDSDRLEQEIVYLTQKMDTDEELQRLSSHIMEVTDVLKRKEPVGRRLDFLMQELNREANTLSSKSGDIETTQAAVDLKVLIEQMREQVQNIE